VQELRTRQILEGAGARLRFVHDKLREVIYGEIPEEERPRLHAAAAAAIEARYVGTADLPAFYPILAHHFATARDDERSREYLGKAGERALATGASAEALGYLRQTLEVDDRCRARAPLPLVLRASWEQQAGRAAFNLAHFDEAERFTLAALRHLGGGGARVEAMDKAASRSAMPWVLLTLVFHLVLQMTYLLGGKRRFARQLGERQRLTQAAHAAEQLAQIHFYQGETVRAFLAAVQANNLAERLGPSPELARGYASLSTGCYAIPLPALAEVYKTRARAAAAALSDPQARSWVSFLAGVTEFINADWAAARASLGGALAMARGIHDYRRAEECLGLLGDVEMFGGRPEDALRIIDELDEVANKSGDTQGQLWALSSRGECLLALGRGDEALALFERYQALCKPDGSDLSERITLGEVALAHFLRGDAERARAVAERTLTWIASRASSSFNLLPSYVATAEVLFGLWEQAGDPVERGALERSARRIVQVLRRYARSFPVGRPYAHRFRGLCEALTGAPARAQRAFARSLAEAERLAMPAAEGLAHYEIGRHHAAGDPRCELHLARARESFERLGMRHWLAATQRLLPGSHP
jgi:tetratricopeptide (TPR) repeat protein